VAVSFIGGGNWSQSCIEALQVNDDDTGAAYEYLFTQCFHSNQNNVEESEVTGLLCLMPLSTIF
jgi:hypothetical protein